MCYFQCTDQCESEGEGPGVNEEVVSAPLDQKAKASHHHGRYNLV